jgi:hypothetical protein
VVWFALHLAEQTRGLPDELRGETLDVLARYGNDGGLHDGHALQVRLVQAPQCWRAQPLDLLTFKLRRKKKKKQKKKKEKVRERVCVWVFTCLESNDDLTKCICYVKKKKPGKNTFQE